MILIGMVAMNAAAQGRGGRGDGGGGGQRGAAGPPAMVLSTTAFPDGGKIPSKYSQEGEQVSPPLTWTAPPNGTMSFVVHVFDMDFAANRVALRPRSNSNLTHAAAFGVALADTKLKTLTD